ncbi:MAG TPA: peptidylprolyl isomerase [Kofleriaceae bacterium]|nr:peptidylprolyl isomerase [Kofleriaceae bacterium]
MIAATAATWLLAGCPAPARPGLPPPEVAAADTALRIRIAQAEARRAGGTAELVVLARRGDKPARLLALRGLGRIGALGTVARSETGGGDPDGSAGGAGGSAPRGIDALIAALGDPDPDVVGAAAAAIGVAAALDDDRDLGASDALVAALPRGGRPVVEALGRAGTAAVQPALVAALGDPRLAELAGLALGRHGRRKIALAEPSRQALIAASSAADPAVRYAAVHALGREYQPPDHPASVAALVARLGDPVAEIRAQAIAALGRRKAAGAAGAAGTKLLLDRDWRVAVEAVRALADSDDGKDAIAAAIVRRFDELGRSEPAAAQVVVEGERALAGAAERPVVGSALGALAGRASTAAGLPALTRGWIGCLAIAAIERARPAPDFEAVARCALPDPLRLPLVADLIEAGAGPLAARRAALDRLTTHPDARVRAAGLGALPALWKAGDASDRASAIATVIAALAARELNLASAAVDAAGSIYDAAGDADRGSLAPLDAAVIARTRAERDPELGAALLQLIGKRRLDGGADACRGALDADPVRARAAIGCLEALGEPRRWTPPAAPPPPPPVDVSTVIGHGLRWRLTTTRGEIVIALHPEVAPWAVAAIVALTRRGFYDGIAFHRVVPDFVVQGGDPTESGSGGPGFALPAEPATVLDGAGYLAGGVGIADAGRDSGGSQWFVMHSRAPHLDGRYTWIGAVESGQKAADALLIGDRVVRAVIEATP